MRNDRLELNVGAIIYKIETGSQKVVRKITIDRVTANYASAGNLKFRRYTNGILVEEVPYVEWSQYSYYVHSDELEESYKKTCLISRNLDSI